MASCQVAAPAAEHPKLYRGGRILSMEGQTPQYAEALLVAEGKILFIGAEAQARQQMPSGTQVVDLAGKALLPGFIDGHSHFINSLSIADQANCYAAPFGPGSTKDGILSALEKLRKDRQIPPGQWIMGYGYDDSLFADGSKLTAADLDARFPDHPVMVGHVSLHGAVLNTVALRKYDITAKTPTPEGGIIIRKPGTQEPEGLLMETAFLPIFAKLPKPSLDELVERLADGQALFAAAGITTAHEGATHLADLDVLERGAEQGRLYLDVVAFPFFTEMDAVLKRHPVERFGRYEGKLKLGGIKITLDGSPQGKTAFFTTPYLTNGPGGEKDWKGEPTFPKTTYLPVVQKIYDLGLPLIAHCNGDAALDMLLEMHEQTLGDRKAGDHRTGIIHCQFVRKDQLDKIAAWKLIPSFYTEHTYFFATTHAQNRGKQQAEFISPLKSAMDRGIVFANHTDFNVAPIDQLFVLWTAVNRLSREGQVVGAGERIPAYEALKAQTIYPAYWYREEQLKGLLKAGKLADLVILDQDPVSVDPTKIKDIRVLETIKEGRTIYSAP